MASSEVKVLLAPGSEVVLASDNPNIGNLVQKIVELKDSLVVEDISVTCDAEGFDADSFTEVIRESTKHFLDSLQLERKAFDKAVKALREEAK